MNTHATTFGPWTSSLDAGSRLTLSAFWKRRLHLLPALQAASFGRRRVDGAVLMLALLLGLAPSVKTTQGDEPAAAKVPGSSEPAEAKADGEDAQFGKVIERTVYDNGHGEYLIDFDSGKVFEHPDGRRFDTEREFIAWARSQGIDAMGQVKSSYKGLIGLEMIAIPTDADGWKKRSGGVVESLEFGDPGTPANMDARAGLPATFFIQTREGSQGVLQILSIDEDNDTPGADFVRLRYKPIAKKVKRLVFNPINEEQESASWNTLHKWSGGKGEFMLTAHVPVGGKFPVQLIQPDGKSTTLFSVELVSGSDKALSVKMIPPGPMWMWNGPDGVEAISTPEADSQRLWLERDQPVDVIVAGEKYTLLFPTSKVAVDSEGTSIFAHIIVTWRPHQRTPARTK